MKRILTILATILVTATAATWAQSPSAFKIGVFDANRVSEETNEGKRIAGKLSAFGDKKKAELAAKEKEVGELRAQLDSQTLSLSPEKSQQRGGAARSAAEIFSRPKKPRATNSKSRSATRRTSSRSS